MKLTAQIWPIRYRPIRVGTRCPDALRANQEGTRLFIEDSRLTILVYRRDIDTNMTLRFSREEISQDLLIFRSAPVLVHRWQRSRMKLMTAVISSVLPKSLLKQWIMAGNHHVQFFLVDLSTGFIHANRLSKMSRLDRDILIAMLKSAPPDLAKNCVPGRYFSVG